MHQPIVSSARRFFVTSAVVALAALGPRRAARADDSPKSLEQVARLQIDEGTVAANPHKYSDLPGLRFAPAAEVEFGYGAVIPTLNVAVTGLTARLGVAAEFPGDWALVLAGESGFALAFNTGNESANYGYLVRVPLAVELEVIRSQLLDYRHQRYLNFHAAVDGGPEFLLAAQCTSGACEYITPGVYDGVGLRMGVSYSALERSAIGVFVTWHNEFAGCSDASSTPCYSWLSTIVWSVGWTLF